MSMAKSSSFRGAHHIVIEEGFDLTEIRGGACQPAGQAIADAM
jgi:hypothetical protein